MKILLSSIVFFILMSSSCVFAQPLKILALGDSYTIGQGVQAADSWPVQLKDRLKSQGKDIATLDIIARTGWTTTDLLSVLDTKNVTHDYDLVFVLIGANDQFQQRPISDFSRELKDLITQAIGFAHNRPAQVFAISIPDWGVSPFAVGRDQKEIARQIDEFNKVAQGMAEKLGVGWINITDVSRGITQPSDFVSDGLHPTAATYSGLVDIIFSMIDDVVSELKTTS